MMDGSFCNLHLALLVLKEHFFDALLNILIGTISEPYKKFLHSHG